MSKGEPFNVGAFNTRKEEDHSTRKILEGGSSQSSFLHSVYMQRVVLVSSAGLFLAETKEDPSNCKLFSLDLVPGGKPDKNTGGSFTG